MSNGDASAMMIENLCQAIEKEVSFLLNLTDVWAISVRPKNGKYVVHVTATNDADIPKRVESKELNGETIEIELCIEEIIPF